MPRVPARPSRAAEAHKLLASLARAFGGAVLFSIPLLMTVEIGSLSAMMNGGRLAALLLLMIPLLIGLDHFAGVQRATPWAEDAVDGMIAYGVGMAASAVILAAMGIVDLTMPLVESIGRVAILAVPAGLGAVLAGSQFRSSDGEDEHTQNARRGYGAELLFMFCGAVFLAFNVAPAEDMSSVAARMPVILGVVVALLTLAQMHAFLYAVRFRGAPGVPARVPHWSLLLRFTVVGYAVALLVSGYVLWTLGRFTGQSSILCGMEMVVLAFPAGLGAAAARLVII